MNFFYSKEMRKTNFHKKRKLICYISYVICMLCTGASFAQERSMASGTVLDQNGKPLANVLVQVKGSGEKVKTTNAGAFSINAQRNNVLIFSIGTYYPYEAIYSGKPVNVQLAQRFLPKFVAKSPVSYDTTGRAYINVLHGEQRESTVIQSVASVGTSQLMTTPASLVLQGLAGKLAGLDVSFNNGSPGLDGNGASYSVRGARAQIILIDGVQRGYTSIDPDQIESVSVYRDALSTVMFGQRSSYGIISIVTKKGDKGSPRISFSSQTAVTSPTALPKPLSAWQYAMLYNEAKQNDAGLTVVAPTYSQADIDAYKNGTDPFGHPDVDWYNTVVKDKAATSRYNFNVQGNGNGFRYFVDLDYLNEGGIFKTSDINAYNTNAQLDRYIARTNLGLDVTKTTFVQLNLFGRILRNNQPGGGTAGLLTSLVNTPQNAYPVFNADGSLAGSSTYGQNVNIYGQAFNRGYQFQDQKDIAVDMEVTQKLDILLRGLYFKAQGSYNNTGFFTTSRAKNFAVFQKTLTGTYNKIGTTTEQTTTGAANDRYRITYYKAQLGYNASFGKNNIEAIALADQQSTLNYASVRLPEVYSDIAARLTYNWDEKYLLEAAGSYAKYNWFAPDKRWNTFGAVGLGYNIHKEDFVKNNLPYVSNLKLKATYGLTGQANTGYYTYIQTYQTSSTNTQNFNAYWFGNAAALKRGSFEGALANQDLGPEKAKKLNLGMDIGLWKDKLSVTGEYFYNRFFDLIGTPSRTNSVLGTTYPSENLQKFNYWGTNLSLSWQSNIHNFNYFISGNLSTVQSKVVFNDELPKTYDYQASTGRQVGMQYGYIATGIFQSYAEINDPNTAVLAAAPKATLRPGDIRYLDRNSDGVIDQNDQGAIGSGKPAIYYGTTMGFSFKGLDFSMNIQGTVNRVTYLSGDFINGFGNGGLNNAYEYNLGRWTPETAATANQPRAWLGSNVNNTQTSTFWIKNSDFIRLKSAEIGYMLPSRCTKKIGIPSFRVFVNGLNLLTFSEIYKVRKDIDPEGFGGSYPIMKSVNLGAAIKF